MTRLRLTNIHQESALGSISVELAVDDADVMVDYPGVTTDNRQESIEGAGASVKPETSSEPEPEASSEPEPSNELVGEENPAPGGSEPDVAESEPELG
jgi:hypothetical protein